MSDDKAQQEPSMEDILASIRRILSEDEVEDKPKEPETPAPEPEPEPVAAAPEPEPPATFAQDDIDSLFDTPAPAPAPEPEPEPEPMPEPEPEPMPMPVMAAPEPEPDDDVLELTDDMMMEEAEPAFDVNEFSADLASFQPEPPPVVVMAPPPPPPPPRGPVEDGLMAQPSIDHGASLLSNLAREIVRQKSFGLGNSAITLEDMVNELLKPILKEWLDQNLPYMIERIVKKEIERMVNRSGDY